jgi:EmrB/QacA subfamily drug resistance transporter
MTTDAAPGLSPAEKRTIIFGMMLAMFLAALDQTIVAPALPTIGAQMGDLSQLSWIVTAYLLMATAVTPLYGKLADIYGRRHVFNAAILIFMLGSLLCALAPSVVMLAIARGVQAIGGGGLIALAQTTIGDAIPPRERGRYQGRIATVFMTASVAGPLIGGVVAEHLHWSVIFWMNLPLVVLALVNMNRVMRHVPVHHRAHRLDWPGAVILIVGVLSLLLALNWGGIRLSWTSPIILALLAAFLLLSLLFAWRLATAAEPLVPLDVLRDRVVFRGTAAAAFGMGTLIGLTVHLPLFLERAMGLTTSQTGIALISLMVGTPIGATLGGHVMARYDRYKWFAQLGLSLSFIAVLTLGLFAARLPLAAILGLLSVTGLGIGTMFPVTTVSVQNAVDNRHLGTVTGALNFMRQLACAITVAVFGTILLAAAGVSSGSAAGWSRNLSLSLPGGTAMAQAYEYVFLAAALCLALSVYNLSRMEERPLRSSDSPVVAASAD